MRCWVSLSALALVLMSWSCRWREGSWVWVEQYDASTDGGDGSVDGGVDGDADCQPGPPGVISAAELLSLIERDEGTLLVLDIRAEALCRSVRIPGALCAPFDEGSLTVDEASLAAAHDIVVYGQSSGEAESEAAESLHVRCDQSVLVLFEGFQGWTEWGNPTES